MQTSDLSATFVLIHFAPRCGELLAAGAKRYCVSEDRNSKVGFVPRCGHLRLISAS